MGCRYGIADVGQEWGNTGDHISMHTLGLGVLGHNVFKSLGP
jgi:hypothetical protein